MSSAKLKKQMLTELSMQPMSLRELAERMELKEKRAYKLLRSLFESEQITCQKDGDGVRRYRPSEK